MSRARCRKQGSGYVLVQALLLIAGLTALLAVLVAQNRANIQVIQVRLSERRAEAAADAALARAMAVLQTANANTVTLNDDWAQLGGIQTGGSGATPASESFDLGNGSTFRLEIVDAASLINVSGLQASGGSFTQGSAQETSFENQLLTLPLTQEQVDCLLDWIETGTTARSDGAKDSYYNALPQPYNTKLGPLTTVDELLLIDNWTAQTVYQPITNASGTNPAPTDANGNVLPLAALFTVDSGAPNTQASGSPRLMLSAAVLQRLGVRNPPAAATRATSFQQLFQQLRVSSNIQQQILNEVTFSNPTTITRLPGKINLNTATQAVLQTIPNITSSMASSIVSQQSTGFSSLGQLATSAGLTPTQVEQTADDFSIGSDTWIVRAWGESGGIGSAIEASVRLTNGQVQVINYSRLKTTTIPTWWGWDDQASTTEDAGASQ